MLENLVYPNICGFCNRVLENGYICEECKKEIRRLDNTFIPFLQNSYFDELYCDYEYSGVVRKKMLAYKFSHKKYLCRTFAEGMIQHLKTKNIKADLVVAVPVHYKRKLTRGYNQSELIAKRVAKALNIPYEGKILIKPVATATQSKLDKEARKQNVKNAFKVRGKINLSGKTILLIDDIYTTGATVNACSEALKKAGAKRIIVSTVAHATIKSHID